MKKKLTLVTFAAAFAAMFGMNLDMAAAQFGAGPRLGNQVAEPDSFRRVATDLNVGLPGRLWISSNFADEGFGYTGSYLTVGGKTRLFEDFLDGRWLTEARLHHSIEDDGGFFANVGIERVFSIKAAGADIVMGGWYDFDGDQQGNFGHDFHQLGINAAIKTRRWDLVGNGYFPIGNRNFTSEGTVGGSFFQGNNILLQQGLDSALTGFDVMLRMRPKRLASVNGTLEVGGYGYSSDLINSFGGGRIRIGAQGKRGVIFGGEINHDDRFRTTGSLNIGYVFGSVGGRNSEYAGIGRDLEETNRNDHIVRFNQSIELAIDPFTGAPYNVIHVQDGVAADGSGTAESPFDSLADAQANSGIGDVIFVGEGGTLDGGIRLQDRQFLLGGGSEQIIDLLGGNRLRLGEDTGNEAILTNVGGDNVVILADNNIVRGVNIDGSGATNGINGNGSNGGTIDNNTVSGAGSFGILLSSSQGDWNISENTLTGNGGDGLFVRNSVDPNATFTISGNNASNNINKGIHFENFEAASVTLSNNITNSNEKNGVTLTNYLTTGGSIDIISHTSDSNGEIGILVDGGDGNLNIVDSTITDNIGGGITVRNFINSDPDQSTFVGNSVGGVSTITGNGVGAGSNIEFILDQAGAQQDILVTGLTVDNGGRGIFASADGVDTIMNIDIIDNVSISENLGDGIRLLADNGATVNANILNTDTIALQMINNARASGASIFVAANGVNGIPPAQINTIIRNVNIELPGSTASSEGISINSVGNSFTTTSISDVDIAKSLVPNIDGFPVIANDTGIILEFANAGGEDLNIVDIEDTLIETDNGISLSVAGNTLADVRIAESEIIAASVVVPPDESRASDVPFTDGISNIFGDRGIIVRTFGDTSTLAVDSLTRLTVTDVLIRDFAGEVDPNIIGDGDFRPFVPSNAMGVVVDQGNGLGFALSGSAVDIATFGDSNLLLDFRNNRILNNGAGRNNDANNNGRFNEQPVSAIEDPNNLLFTDAVRINAFGDSRISARIINNLFQDNFERGLALDTYQSATINALITDNAFDGNDRGQDGNNNPPGGNGMLNDSTMIDFEAINNEEFFLRSYESNVVLDNAGNPIDLDNDNVADFGVLDDVPFGFANMCIDLSNNVFALNAIVGDFSLAPGDLRLGLDGATNGNTITTPFPADTPTLTNFGLCEQLITTEELFFAERGFVTPGH